MVSTGYETQELQAWLIVTAWVQHSDYTKKCLNYMCVLLYQEKDLTVHCGPDYLYIHYPFQWTFYHRKI